MSGMGGLIELVLVLGLVLGWGFIELRSNRRERRKAEEARMSNARDASIIQPRKAEKGDRA